MLITRGLGEQFVNEIEDIREGVLNALGQTGLLQLPLESDVRENITYGANEEFEGTLKPTTIYLRDDFVKVKFNDNIKIGIKRGCNEL